MEDCIVLGKHKGCKYGGTVCRLTHNGTTWDWCNGRSWESVTFESIPKHWKFCGASTLKGDVVEVEDV